MISAALVGPAFLHCPSRISSANFSWRMPDQGFTKYTDRIALDEAEIVVTFIRASGPGGQNVNKVSSAAQLRFDVRRSSSLPDAVRLRLERIAGARLTKDGEIVLTAGNFRTQEANRRDAIGRLVRMIRQAAVERRVRTPTRPTLGAKQRRLTGKAKRGEVKRQRRPPGLAGD